MKIVVGSVVKGFTLKIAISAWLEQNGYEVLDVGCYDTSRFVKFTSVAERAAFALQQRQAERAVLCCGSGTGMALAAGKFSGICAVSVESPLAAEFARRVNDANVICMGESLVTPDVATRIVHTFLNTPFREAPGIASEILSFWEEARNEIYGRGATATDRVLETLH